MLRRPAGIELTCCADESCPRDGIAAGYALGKQEEN